MCLIMLCYLDSLLVDEEICDVLFGCYIFELLKLKIGIRFVCCELGNILDIKLFSIRGFDEGEL